MSENARPLLPSLLFLLPFLLFPDPARAGQVAFIRIITNASDGSVL